MPDNNLPASAGPVDVPAPLPTEDSLIEDISDLLDDSPASANPVEEPEEAAAQPEDDDPLGLGAEDVAADGTAEAGDESEEPEIKGGRFAPDTAKVTLDDGTVTTIAELKRGTLFQRDYTKKTQELSKERETFEAERQQVGQYAQQLDQSREYLAWYAEQNLPKQPQEPGDPNDYVAWHNYRLEMDRWNTHVHAYQQFQADKEAEGQRRAGETQKQHQERLKRERDALLNAIPVLKDPVKGKKVWENIVAGASRYYGIPEEVLNTRTSHIDLVVLRDALAYRRIKDTAPKVQAEVSKRPVVNNARRAAPNAAQNREKQARTERLRNSGSFEDGVAALQDFDL
jgi:hypothetical protein